jgi:hypothetical protein
MTESLSELDRLSGEVRRAAYDRYKNGGPFIRVEGKNEPGEPWRSLGEWRDWMPPLSVRFLRLAPTSTPEQLRVEANLALKAEWEKERFPLQFRNHCWYGDSIEPSPWIEAEDFTLDYVDSIEEASHLEWRRRPEPTWRPWTLETRPEGAVWVRLDGDEMKGEYVVVEWHHDGATVHGFGLRTYAGLLENFTQRDGSRCGTMEVEP